MRSNPLVSARDGRSPPRALSAGKWVSSFRAGVNVGDVEFRRCIGDWLKAVLARSAVRPAHAKRIATSAKNQLPISSIMCPQFLQ